MFHIWPKAVGWEHCGPRVGVRCVSHAARDPAKSSDESIVDCVYSFQPKSHPHQILMT